MPASQIVPVGAYTDTVTVAGSVSPVLLFVPASASHALYGRIPAGQIPAVGAYSDSLTVTIDY